MATPPAGPLSKPAEGMLKSLEQLPLSRRRAFFRENGKTISGFARANKTFGDRLKADMAGAATAK